MNWEEQAQAFLQANQYHELSQWCEQAIREGSNGSLPYWYLGLIYLLQENVEQAQGVWLAGMFEAPGEEDSEQRTEQLVSILEAEAEQQQAQEKLEISLQLREQLQELNPHVNNLLKLLEVSVRTHQFQPELIQELQLLENLKSVSKDDLDQEQLQKTIILILSEVPIQETEEMLALTAELVKSQSHFLEQVLVIASNYTFPKARVDIGIKLAETCYKIKPNLINGIKKLSLFYTQGDQYKNAIQKARDFQSFCQTIPGKIEGSTILLKALLSAGSLSEAIAMADTHKELLKKIISNPPETLISETHDAFPLAVFYLAYLADNAQENRWLQNQVMQLYDRFLPNRDSSIHYQPKQYHLIKNRRLKVGYIAHTFRKNAVGWLCRWLVQNHNRDAFHITLYLVYQNEDELTRELIENVDQVRRFNYNERAIAQQIIDDEIDILVDLDSLTVTPTCRTLCYRVAPIQLTWLGWDASGLPNMDYYLADPYVLPEKAQDYYHETIWRLPSTYVAVKGFEVGIPSVKREDLDIPESAIVYFSSQGAFKRHPDTVRLQMRILKAVPNSYFLIKGKSDHDLIQDFFQEIAEAEGVNPNRLRFLPWSPNEFIHRANLGIADVVLDTYPYNGATTTLETLWMGVPLVTKVGEQYVARNSYTFLKNVGVEEGIAWTDEEYVEWGVKFGTDENLRRDVHWKLLQSRKTAPLWNVEQFVTDMETAYQQMWAKYVSENSDKQLETLPLNLHIGGKEQHPDWKIVDVEPRSEVDYVTNASDLSMFESDSVDTIYSSHTLEHFYYGINDELLNTLKEWYRVLKPDGKLMISVPDLEVLSGLYIRKDLNFQQRFHIMRMMFGGQTNIYDVHKVGFDFTTLKVYLEKANFKQVSRVKEFNLFNDCSSLKFLDTLISLNVVAYKDSEFSIVKTQSRNSKISDYSQDDPNVNEDSSEYFRSFKPIKDQSIIIDSSNS